MTINEIRNRTKPVFAVNNVTFAGVFGSVARGEGTPSSDIDLLVALRGRRSLLDLIRLQRELEEVLQHRVDLIPIDSLHPRVKPQAMAELCDIYGQRPAL
ncbi:hypothetical protein A3I40_01235 [Candidatus Uhrbacteria bacterium RIFCSPLOWO2_02_FULL_48_12]|uniref:Polymerase nucleotidyl transferase domain-containing protein n=1 Tax=Candidatus Uhrbacteria bacterium RIFCSPLOWO2_02_FULL_48_12 TaxID=1802407 RepID=A0A1F7VAP2_9BACT|nr:MAG: hypothetical protein A3I40_01235 [Candidatus Uhrbacteria bacterium RIFCSPLOWO2_02_FULL_48_12]